MPIKPNNFSRGGGKPRMLPSGSRDVPITIGSSRKTGIYEISAMGDTLARRVELPEWLSLIALSREKPFRAMFVDGDIQHPHNNVAESQGHIFVEPPAELEFTTSAVGVDIEIADSVLTSPSLRTIRFYVFAHDYKSIESWWISRDDFLMLAKRVETSKGFMPQLMVSIADLKT